MTNLPKFDFKTEAVLISPDGGMDIIQPEKELFGLTELYNHLRCSMIEIVRLRGNVKLPAMVLIVDEEGKFNHSEHNQVASDILDSRADNIVGRAIYCWRKLIN